MPELPDITLYLEALEARVLGTRLETIRLSSPFLLRSVEPPLAAAEGRRVIRLTRLGKRIVIGLSGDLHLILHLMIAGRLRFREVGAKPPGRIGLAVFEFETGCLVLSEAGRKKRASLHLVRGSPVGGPHDPGGLEVLECGAGAFHRTLTRENHTLKRALTDPRLLSGIGNAYSDEILHRARLSPFRQTRQLSAEESRRLHEATVTTLNDWIRRLREEARGGFPEKVTAFRKGMAVHGRYDHPCPDCGTAIQRIRYATNESNYCPRCQTEGRLLADRGLSRLLRRDWPKTVDELESLKNSDN